MNARALLVVVRDVVTLAVGAGGTIHEEFYTTSERPVLIALYGACLAGLALANGRKLVQSLASVVTAEREDGAPTVKSGTSERSSSSP